MVGQKVHHKSFGAGRIVEYNGSYLTVAFADMEKKFVYPDVFESFLCFEDGELQKKAISALQEKRTAQVTTSVVNTAPSLTLLKNRAKVNQKKITKMMTRKLVIANEKCTSNLQKIRRIAKEKILY